MILEREEWGLCVGVKRFRGLRRTQRGGLDIDEAGPGVVQFPGRSRLRTSVYTALAAYGKRLPEEKTLASSLDSLSPFFPTAPLGFGEPAGLV